MTIRSAKRAGAAKRRLSAELADVSRRVQAAAPAPTAGSSAGNFLDAARRTVKARGILVFFTPL